MQADASSKAEARKRAPAANKRRLVRPSRLLAAALCGALLLGAAPQGATAQGQEKTETTETPNMACEERGATCGSMPLPLDAVAMSATETCLIDFQDLHNGAERLAKCLEAPRTLAAAESVTAATPRRLTDSEKQPCGGAGPTDDVALTECAASLVAKYDVDGRTPVIVQSEEAPTETSKLQHSCNGVAATIVGSSGDDFIFGTIGTDVIAGLDGDDIVIGLGGEDLICGDGGDDILVLSIGFSQGYPTLFGGFGDDSLVGSPIADFIYGGWGNDTVWAGSGDDVVLGGPQASACICDDFDTAWGQDGSDLILGGQDTDHIWGGRNADILLGQGGIDLMWGDGLAAWQEYGGDHMWGGPGNDRMKGGLGVDFMWGESGDDTMSGGDQNDEMYGDAGYDKANGGAGSDLCFSMEETNLC